MAFSKWKTPPQTKGFRGRRGFLGVHVHTATACRGPPGQHGLAGTCRLTGQHVSFVQLLREFCFHLGALSRLEMNFTPVEKCIKHYTQSAKKRDSHFFESHLVVWLLCNRWFVRSQLREGSWKGWNTEIPPALPRRPTRILGKLSWWFGNKARNQEQVHPWSSWFGVGKDTQQQTSSTVYHSSIYVPVFAVSEGRRLPTLYHIYMLHSCGWECKRVGYWFLILWVYSCGHSCFKIQTKLISVFFPNSVYGGSSGWALTFQFIITRAIYRMLEPSQIHSVPRPQGCSCLSVVFFLESDSDRGYIFMHLCIHIYIY